MAILLTLTDKGAQMVTESTLVKAISTGRGTTRVWFANDERSYEVHESPEEIMSKLEAWHSLKSSTAAPEQY